MPKKKLAISLGAEAFIARPGDHLLDAALLNGIEFPYDCRVGHCGTCTVKVNDGMTIGGEAGQRGRVRACQARVFSDLDLVIEKTPAQFRVDAQISDMRELAHGIVELTLTPRRQLEILPGQYCRLQFKGYPARNFSPTASLDSGEFRYCLKFHIKRVRDGQVTPQLGARIGLGHMVRIEGPFGASYLRPGRFDRLVLAGSGTGFAPVWAIAAAALNENPDREIIMVCGARDPRSFYMSKALAFAARHRNVLVVPTLEQLPQGLKFFAKGAPTDFMPQLRSSDLVYAAGSPEMVSKAARVAEASGAEFYADPFELSAKRPVEGEKNQLVSKILSTAGSCMRFGFQTSDHRPIRH